MRITQYVATALDADWYAACDSILRYVVQIRPECSSLSLSLAAQHDGALCRIELVTGNGVSSRFEVEAQRPAALIDEVRSRFDRFLLVSLPKQSQGIARWAA
ncbi:MAG: hypothetical protein AAF658_10120 [Myxococcota bacterium]